MSNQGICVVGIDPGLDGGIALITLGKLGEPGQLWVIPMPTKPGATTASGHKGRDIDCIGIANWLEATACMEDCVIKRVALEVVHSMPKQGVTSSFNFGKGYGCVLGVISTMRLPLLHVQPTRWKKSVLDGLGREKSDAIRFAMSMFPKEDFKATPACKVEHDGMAEATCLAEYARREVLGFVSNNQKAN